MWVPNGRPPVIWERCSWCISINVCVCKKSSLFNARSVPNYDNTYILHVSRLLNVFTFVILAKATTSPRIPSTRMALQNFDMTYSLQFGSLWPSIRISLLSEQKYGALFNNFSDVEQVTQELEQLNAVDFIWQSRKTMQELDSMQEPEKSQPTMPPKPQTQPLLSLPSSISPNIKCYTFPKGDTRLFHPARYVAGNF